VRGPFKGAFSMREGSRFRSELTPKNDQAQRDSAFRSSSSLPVTESVTREATDERRGLSYLVSYVFGTDVGEADRIGIRCGIQGPLGPFATKDFVEGGVL
jgi:hypothetical protein